MKNITSLTFKLTPIALALMSAISHAENSLDTVVVTANSADTNISEVAATMWVIDQDQIELEINTGADLKVALGRLIPGYDFGGESRTNYAQNMRGRSALIMIDGVSLNSTRSISRQLDSISPFNVARVEVLSGATAIYGSGASGGIINIITKKSIPGETQVELTMGGSSGFNSSQDTSANIGIAVSGGTETLRGRLSASYEETGASYSSNGDMVLPDITQTDRQFNNTTDIMGNIEYQPDDNQLLSVTAQYYNSAQDTDYSADLGPNLAGAYGLTDITISNELDLDDQPKTERIMLNAQYNNKEIWGQNLIAQAYFRNEEMQFFPFPSYDADYGWVYSASLQKTEAIGAKLLLSKDFNDVKLSYGIDTEIESFSATATVYDSPTAMASGGLDFDQIDTVDRYPDIDTQKVGAFIQTNWDINPDWKVSGGVRYQYISHDISDHTGTGQQLLYGNTADVIEGGTTDYNEVVTNLGVIYSINKQQQIWANLTQGFEIPDPAKYYGNGTYSGPTLVSSINVKENELEAIKTNSVELGWRIDTSKYDAQIAAYYSLSDKTTSYDSATFEIIVNDDQKRMYGIEGQANYRFTDTWYTGVQAHLIESETKSSGDWAPLSAELASPSNASLRGGYDNLSYGAEIQLQALSNYSDDTGGEINGYSLMNVSSYYTLPVGKLSVGIQNLLNRDYYTVWSQRAQIFYGGALSENVFKYKGTGRTYALNYNVEF